MVQQVTAPTHFLPSKLELTIEKFLKVVAAPSIQWKSPVSPVVTTLAFLITTPLPLNVPVKPSTGASSLPVKSSSVAVTVMLASPTSLPLSCSIQSSTLVMVMSVAAKAEKGITESIPTSIRAQRMMLIILFMFFLL